MKNIKFEVYLGRPMVSGQNETVNAVVLPLFSLPHGKCNLDGTTARTPDICFQNLHDLGTYFADWIDLLGEKTISATIHLNTNSNKKAFTGATIIDIIDKIAKVADYKSLKNFKEIESC